LVDLLREHHRDRLDENAALLAHHLEQAGRLADAAAWHARAAEWVERRDVAEGMRHWRRVIEIEDGLPQAEGDGDLHARAYAGALHLCWRMGLSRDETRELLERGMAVADRIGNPSLRAKMLIPYAVICGVCGDDRERIRWSRAALELARGQGDRELEISARVPLATALAWVGPLPEALDVIDEGLGASSPEENLGRRDWDLQPYAYLLAVRSFIAARLGDHETAQKDAERAVEMARRDGSSDDLLCSHHYASLSAGLRGDRKKALDHAIEALGAAKKRASPGTTTMALMAAGEAYLHGGALQDALEHLESAWPEELPDEGWRPRMSALAQAYLALGDLGKSRHWAERGLCACREGGHRLEASRVHLVMARLLLHPEVNGSREDIEAEIERADALTRESGARGLLPSVLEVRAELARREGDATEAGQMLREAHRLYTEMAATGHAERVARELEAK
jgi:tetratricopeptide (TPR) repeat protein